MRRTGVLGLLTCLVVLVGGVLTGPPASAAARMWPWCETGVFGVTSSGRLQLHSAASYDVTDAGDWDLGALDFTPTTMVRSDRDRYSGNDFTATAADGVARRVYVDRSSDPPVLTVTPDGSESITPKALTYGGWKPAFFYSVSATGNLWRYDEARASGPVFRGGVQVRTGLEAVQTLTYHKRTVVHGREVDLLLATTSYGRLFAILVPVDAPRSPRTIRLAASGFASYDGVVAVEGACDDDEGDQGMLAIDSTTGATRWYYLGRDPVPVPWDLEQDGPSVPYGDWRLHPVF